MPGVHVAAHKFCKGVEAVVGGFADIVEDVVGRHLIEFLVVDMADSVSRDRTAFSKLSSSASGCS